MDFYDLVFTADPDRYSIEVGSLGLLNVIKGRSQVCGLCALIADAATRLISRWATTPPLESIRCVLGAKHFVSTTKIHIHRPFVKLEPSPLECLDDTIDLQACWDVELEEEPVGATARRGDTATVKNGQQKHAVYLPEKLFGSGREMGRLLDTQRIRDWLRSCETKHGDQCHSPPWLGDAEQPDFLRVIDVRKRHIIDAPPNCRYLAVSYVWGDSARLLKCTTSNMSKMRNEFGLDDFNLPRTITDSMSLVKALGEQYLWMDCLCIVHDDTKDLQRQIKEMDLIYSKALLTIVIASGSSVDAGLPGMAEGSREVPQRRVKVNDKLSIKQSAVQGNSEHLQYSKWNSRGWTFQERLLSRRALIFLQNTVFWTCETSKWTEETILEPEVSGPGVPSHSLACFDEWDDDMAKFTLPSMYYYTVQFTSRDFTYQSDALPAFLGVLNRVEHRTKERFLWGLLRTRFDQSLAWPFGSVRRHEVCPMTSESGITHKVPYPSWSWLGWQGLTGIGTNCLNEELRACTANGATRSELTFYLLMSDGSIQPVEEPDSDPDSDHTESAKPSEVSLERLRKQWKGNTKVKGPVALPSRVSSQCATSIISGTGEEGVAEVTRNSATSIHPTSCLVFWTSYAEALTWRLSNRKGFAIRTGGKNVAKIDISLSKSEDIFDSRVYATSHATVNNDTLHVSPETSRIDVPDDSSEPSDLSLWENSEDKRILRSETAGRHLHYIVISRFYEIGSAKETGRLNLLIIEWSDQEESLASRVGTAQIAEQDWIGLNLQWKMVILE